MKVNIEVTSGGEDIINATVEMDEKVFFGLKCGDEIEIDFEDQRTELTFCAWHKEPLRGLFGFDISEIDNNFCHRGKEPGRILCIIYEFVPKSDEE